MCRVLAERNPQRYHQINRSLRIAGHSTSIRLEAAFWGMLDEIADAQGLSTAKLIAALHDEAVELNNGMANFASVLRTTCLLYAREQASR
jgi:predicted DNA-binding ribbon-helix-helix protein